MIVGVQVTQRGTFRGSVEDWGNVFHYDVDDGYSDAAGLEALGDNIVTKFKQLVGNTVTFRSFRVFGPTNLTKADNIMRVVKDVSGTGTVALPGIIYPELCAVVQMYVGRGPKGGKQYLRKYIRVPGVIEATASVLAGISPLSSGDQGLLKSRFEAMKNLSWGVSGNAAICTPSGKHLPLLTGAEVLPYLHTRQMHQ